MKKVAIVTGASRGIGAATAKLLAKNGYAVCVNYHQSAAEAEKVVADITAHGGEAIAVKADMGREDDIIALFNTVDARLGTVTALVNNAGINGGISKVEDLLPSNLDAVFKTNVYGAFYACREALKRMKTQKHGAIVNVTSEAARFGGNHMAHYAASKAAVNTFTIAFAREAGLDNVRVNAVSPGIIETDMYKDASDERIAQLKKSIPLSRLGSADEVAKTIEWLISESASYVNGVVLPVAAGR